MKSGAQGMKTAVTIRKYFTNGHEILLSTKSILGLFLHHMGKKLLLKKVYEYGCSKYVDHL